MTESAVKRIVIVGGGSAGWIAAGTIAARFQPGALVVTLIESPDLAIMGVGEGTWPSMRHTLKQMGIRESDFISKCDASFKQGSQFFGWKNRADRYYHPFTTPPGYAHIDLHAAWKRRVDERPFADVVSVQSQVCESGCAPKQFSTPEYAGVTNYGYHLDAEKFVKLLRDHCVETLGVTHLVDHVTRVVTGENDDVSCLETSSSGAVKGDLFIDCSGVKAILLSGHYNIPILSQEHILFNDMALAARVPYASGNGPIVSTTVASAQSAGWIWDIGLQTRRGIGYVCSSRYIEDVDAEAELRQHIRHVSSESIAADISVRKLNFNPGYRAKFWHKNCVAVGMSMGFIEPLEASALALVELSCDMLCDEMPINRQHMDIVSKRFNERFRYRWERVIEFLKLHYVLSDRCDSEYWRDHVETTSVPPRLQELLSLWRYQPPSRHDLIQNEEIFSSASYQYVLYGMGFETTLSRNKCPNNDKLAARYFAENTKNVAQYISALPSNRELVEYMKTH